MFKKNLNLPLVSIIIPTYNSGKFIENCLLSILKQSYTNIEIIIVDNFSTDNTKNISQNFTNNFFLKGPERSAQRNFGFEISNGSYVCFIDSDMVLTSNVIRDCVNTSLHFNCESITIPEKSYGNTFMAKCKSHERQFYVGISWVEASRFYSRKLLNKIGVFNVDMVSGEDWDLSYRAGLSSKVKSINSLILHNEGDLTFIDNLKKKFYYGKKIRSYLFKSESKNKLLQVNFLNRITLYLKKPKLFFMHPILSLSVIIIKVFEYVAGGLGFMLSFLDKNDY